MSVETFDDRLTIQKAVYIAQQADVFLGYHYSWYLRGPYSRELTADAYSMAGSSIPEGWFLDDDLKKKLKSLRIFLEKVKKATKNPVRELEKLASVLFVIKTGQATADDSIGVTGRMTAAGKDFSKEEVTNAIKLLQEKKFI